MVDDSNKAHIIFNIEKMFKKYELKYLQFDTSIYHNQNFKLLKKDYGTGRVGLLFYLTMHLNFVDNKLLFDQDKLLKLGIVKKNDIPLLLKFIEYDLLQLDVNNNIYSTKLIENNYIMKIKTANREINKLNESDAIFHYSLKSCEEIQNQYSQEGNINVIMKTEKKTGIIEENKDITNDNNKTSNIVINGKQSLDKFLADKFSNDEEKEENYLKNINLAKTN